MFVGSAYDSSLMRMRMYGSTEKNSVRARNVPSCSGGSGRSTSLKSDSCGTPSGLAARTIIRFRMAMASHFQAR